jgi:hypothetical protein
MSSINLRRTRRPSKSQQIATLQQQVRGLETRLDQHARGQEVTLSILEFLLPALEGEIGATASEVTVSGKLKVATVGSVRVRLDGFARKAHLNVNGPRSQSVAPVDLEFDENGKLNAAQMRAFKGFLAEIENPVRQTAFWDGVKAPAA